MSETDGFLPESDVQRIAEAVHARFDTLPEWAWEMLSTSKGGYAWSPVGFGAFTLRQHWRIASGGTQLELSLETMDGAVLYRKTFVKRIQG